MELLKKGHPVKYVIERSRKREHFIKENAESIIKEYSESFKEFSSLSEPVYSDVAVYLTIKPN